MAILKHIASKSSNYGAALEYLIFKHDELRKTPILDQNGNRIMRDEFYLDGLNCEPYSFDAACQQLNREYQKNKNKNEIKSHHYIISFDPRDSTENCLTGKRAQELGLEYAKANFPGHQALVCTHMDGHNGSGNIHVHIVINSLRKLDVPKQPFMERPIDCKAGYKHHVTNEYLKHLQKSLMNLCRCEFLHQVDLLSPSRTGVTEAEYWAQRRLDEKKQKIETEGFTPNPTKFQTQKQLIRDAVAAAIVTVHVRTDQCLMPRKICFCIFQSKLLRPFSRQTIFCTVARIEADNVMVAFDFILIFVLLIFAVQLLAGCIERIGFTVQAVQIKLIPHDTIAVFVQYRSFTILVMFENQIFQCSTIVGTLTCDML